MVARRSEATRVSRVAIMGIEQLLNAKRLEILRTGNHSRSGNPGPIPFGVERFITKRRLPPSLSHQAMTVSPSFRREMLEG
jgi:hypothetical protein